MAGSWDLIAGPDPASAGLAARGGASVGLVEKAPRAKAEGGIAGLRACGRVAGGVGFNGGLVVDLGGGALHGRCGGAGGAAC